VDSQKDGSVSGKHIVSPWRRKQYVSPEC
jgi:hypothetical protein